MFSLIRHLSQELSTCHVGQAMRMARTACTGVWAQRIYMVHTHACTSASAKGSRQRQTSGTEDSKAEGECSCQEIYSGSFCFVYPNSNKARRHTNSQSHG